MPRDSNGVMTLPASTWVQTGDTVLPVQHNPPFREIENALTNSLDRDGRTVMTGNLQMGGNKVTGLGDPSLPGDAMTRRVSGIEFETRSHAEAWAGTSPMPESIVIRYYDDRKAASSGSLWRRALEEPTHMGKMLVNGFWYEMNLPGASVTQFGAVGDYNQDSDEGTDNSPAFQNAFDAAWLSGGGRISIPPGHYVLRSQVKYRADVSVHLDPGAHLYRGHDFTMFTVVDSAYPETQAMGYEGASNIHWDGGVIDLNSLNYPNAANGFAMAHGRNYSFRNMVIKDVFAVHALDVNGIDGLLIENVRFEGWFEDTGSGPGHFPGRIREAVQLTYASGDLTPTKNVRIRNCYVGPSDTPGSLSWPTGFGNHGWHTPEFVSNVLIEGCVFEDCLYAGVRPYSFDNVRIKNNTFLRCERGVYLSNARMNSADTIDADGVQRYQAESNRNVFILNNEFRECATQAIQGIASVGSAPVMEGYEIPWQKNIYVQGNSIISTFAQTGGAINLQWVDGLWVQDNYIRQAFRGAYIGFVKNAQVARNIVSDTTEEGMYILEPTNGPEGDWSWARGVANLQKVHIRDNIVRNCGYHGVRVSNLVRGFLIGNCVGPCSREVDNVYDSIRISGSSTRVSVKGNMTPIDGENSHRYGLVVLEPATRIEIAENEFEGRTGGRTISTSVVRGGSAILLNFDNDAEAAAGGVPIDGKYRTGSIQKVRVT